jgi:ADP-ribosylglycohydrolase
LRSNLGSDESSIVDCFLKFVGNYDYTTRKQFVWDWVSYHELHHGTGYGRTMKDHFNLVAYMRKHTKKYLDLDSRLNKLQEIAKDADSFGNGSLALVYPAYYYAAVVGEEPRELIRYVTSFTHSNEDATRAVNLLMDIIEGKHVEAPTEEFIRENCFAEHATAYNTLLTAMFIADVDTEMEVIRRGVWVCGDTDSTLATAMLIWKLKQQIQ